MRTLVDECESSEKEEKKKCEFSITQILCYVYSRLLFHKGIPFEVLYRLYSTAFVVLRELFSKYLTISYDSRVDSRDWVRSPMNARSNLVKIRAQFAKCNAQRSWLRSVSNSVNFHRTFPATLWSVNSS